MKSKTKGMTNKLAQVFEAEEPPSAQRKSNTE